MPTATAPRGTSPARRAMGEGRRRAALGALGVLAALSALCAYLIGAAPPAAAHAVLTGSDPASGAVVADAPREVTLTFSESVQLSDDSIRVLRPDGDRADTGDIRDHGTDGTARYGAPLRGDLPDGTYTVAWQAVSADSHPISGAFTFSIGAPSPTSVDLTEQQQTDGGTVGLLYDLARYAAYAGFVLLVGGTAFVLACWPLSVRVRAVQRLVTGGWVGLTAATLAMLLLRTPYTGSGELADALDLGGLGDVVSTKTGTALVSRLLLLATSALFTAVLFGTYARTTESGDADPAHRRDLVAGLGIGGAVVSTGLAVTWAVSEHASTGIQTAVAMPVDVVHLLAVAAWLGGLATLAAALHSGTGAVPRAAVRRFSRIALGSVAVLAATGTYQSWRQVGSWSALTGTDYGRLLLVKVGLIAGLVGVAAVSRRWTTRLTASTRDAEPAQHAEPSQGTEPTDSTESSPPAEPSADAADVPPTASATVAAAVRPAATSTLPGGNASAPTAGRDRDAVATSGDAKAPRPATADDAGSGAGPARPDAVGAHPEPHPTRTGSRAETTPTARTGNGGTAAEADPVRAGQLARQRAAVETARRKRQRDADPQRAGLRRSVLAETCLAVAVLAVTTLLTGTEPARTAQAADATTGPAADAPPGPRELTVPFDTGGPRGEGTAEVTLDPGRTGRNALTVRITGPAGKPLDVPEVKASFTLPARDIGPLRTAPDETAPGRWRDPGLRLPVPGAWELALTVRTSDIDQITETRTVRIG